MSKICTWLPDPLSDELRHAFDRLARAPDVQRVAVMPDAHLSREVCIGTVLGTTRRLYPAAIGNDVGCGVATVALNGPSTLNTDQADRVQWALRQMVPVLKHRKAPGDVPPGDGLSAKRLCKLARREGALQFGSLGRSNHFLELNRDDSGRLWAMVHSGSRAMGPAIQRHHRRIAGEGALVAIDANSEAGERYLSDLAWARAWAVGSRRQMLLCAIAILEQILGSTHDSGTWLDCDHNHVRRELVSGIPWWVHRKGAIVAAEGVPGLIPGSMGTHSYHVLGRGCDAAMGSSSHGAGRCMSRTEARYRVTPKDFHRTTRGVYVPDRPLLESAPDAYKDIDRVMRAQRELTRVIRRVRPVLVYRAGPEPPKALSQRS